MRAAKSGAMNTLRKSATWVVREVQIFRFVRVQGKFS
jgi:hypothetical protein